MGARAARPHFLRTIFHRVKFKTYFGYRGLESLVRAGRPRSQGYLLHHQTGNIRHLPEQIPQLLQESQAVIADSKVV